MDRIEACVAHSARDGVLLEAVVQVERLKGADAATQTLLATRVPADEERKLHVGKAGLAHMLVDVLLIEVRVEHVEAEVDHVVTNDSFVVGTLTTAAIQALVDQRIGMIVRLLLFANDVFIIY